jgi:hypothetical protein
MFKPPAIPPQTGAIASAHRSAPAAPLEPALAAVEQRLAALGEALRHRDAPGIDRHTGELHQALAMAAEPFTRAARSGALPPALRERLALANGAVAAQRESLARTTASLDRAIDVLLPRNGSALYSTQGNADRPALGGAVQA